MIRKNIFRIFLTGIFLYTGSSALFAQKTVGLDNWFNHEINAKTGKIYHYTWNDSLDSGFSQLGDVFMSEGARLATLSKAPTPKVLSKVDIYIIVDPDTIKENPNPNYVTSEDIRAITQWVKKGGVLLLMANDGPNCEFTHFNRLSTVFGFYFRPITLNPVVNHNWEMGAETNLPDHPLFKGVHKIYLKEVAPILLSHNAVPVLNDKGNILIAETRFGKGFVLAVGDPWLYNEYIGHNHLPESFDNGKAAVNLCNYLLGKTIEK